MSQILLLMFFEISLLKAPAGAAPRGTSGGQARTAISENGKKRK